MPSPTDAYKIPPHDKVAEKSVLGAILIDSSAFNIVAEFLKSEYFYSHENQLIYSAMVSLFEKQQPIDLVTLQDELKKQGSLKKIGGSAYLTDLISTVPTSAYIEHYGQIVKSNYAKRKLIQISSRTVERAFDEMGDAKNLLDNIEGEIFALSQEHTHRDFIELKEVLAESFERLDEFMKKGTHVRGLATGFNDIDAKLAGLQQSNLLILAARPGIGKTTLALNVGLNIAIKEKTAVGFFSLEMSKEELVDRLLVGQADIDAWRLKTGRLSEDDYKRLTDAMGVLSEAPIYIDDTPGISILEMRTKARKLKSEKNLGFLIVDYLQLADSGKRFDSRVQEVSFVSQGLKNLARELKIPVMAISQLSRAVEQRGTKKPQLSDLRESGCLAGDSLIMRADTGELCTIEALAKRKIQEVIPVYSLDNDWKLAIKTLVKAFSSGRKKIYELKTQSGRVVKASANHPFKTLKGWTRLDHLQIDDRIALPRLYNHLDRPISLSDNELILLAHLLGDGCILPRQPFHYTSADEVNIRIVEKTARDLFDIKGRIVRQNNWYHLYLPSPYRLTHKLHHPITNWYKSLGIQLSRSYEKEIPAQVFQSSNEKIGLFLKHLWSTDGNISWKKIKGKLLAASIYYSSTSKKLIVQIQHLLLRLGILSTIRKTEKKGYRLNWQVHIQGAKDQLVFLKEVGCYGKRGEIIKHIIKALNKIKTNPNIDIIPKEIWGHISSLKNKKNISWRQFAKNLQMSYCGSSLFKNGTSRTRLNKIANIFNDHQLTSLAQSDVYWDRIVAIEPLGVEEVYDVTVNDTHNFIANDVIVHNSIEQDADIVMFIYREGDSEDLLDETKMLVKLYVAKHRNGATGEIDLMFRGDRVKFYGVER